ncbi:MAG: 30S ribosomal protein S7 [Methanosarcinales archaeon]|uniref:Small ribosomal subunit protein uS7 n=1 Tax=Candidatus Ethanoperedens thermophilum TaxID=2766897 RepID=A0A848D9Y6_9EURY|nr:30S ribosomal protein S7 [Candidatus Ethanoperedens thermophilum]
MKLFDQWDTDVEVKDRGMARYINTTPTVSLHSGGRHARQQFNKSNLPIVERLINSVMRREENNGKKILSHKIVKECFEIINRKTKENPMQVLVDAITNVGPREEIVRLKYGGISIPKAVDSAPQRRVDLALRFITEGASKSAFKSKRSMPNALADELIASARYDVKSYSIGKKDGLERVAKAAR